MQFSSFLKKLFFKCFINTRSCTFLWGTVQYFQTLTQREPTEPGSQPSHVLICALWLVPISSSLGMQDSTVTHARPSATEHWTVLGSSRPASSSAPCSPLYTLPGCFTVCTDPLRTEHLPSEEGPAPFGEAHSLDPAQPPTLSEPRGVSLCVPAPCKGREEGETGEREGEKGDRGEGIEGKEGGHQRVWVLFV